MSTPLRLGTTRGRGALATTVLGSGMVFLDSTIANIAAAHIGAEFHATFAQLQWVLNAYLLTLASLILLGGALGDRLGRRRVFLIGTVWFASASALCAIAPNIELLIAARALQGVGGALLTPGSLAIISASFVADDRATAVGLWSGLAGFSTALGPLLGGWLVQDVSWRWAFAINVPIAVAVVTLGVGCVPESRAEHRAARLDLRGAALAAAALALLTYGLTTAGAGWSATALATTFGGVGLGIVFAVTERDTTDPLVPLGLFRNKTFAGTNLMTLLCYASLGTMLFLLVVHLQVSAGYGALEAGLATLPITLAMLFGSGPSAKLAGKIGPRRQLIAGPLLAAAGFLLLLRVDATQHAYLTDVLPGLVVFAAGLVSFVAPLTATVMAAAPGDLVGVASGVNNAIARIGSLLAVAVIPPLGGLHGENYREVAVMVHGYRVGIVCCVVLQVAAAAIVAVMVRAGRQEV
jgi:EmrB/QacA subfamily drug resistance transporter